MYCQKEIEGKESCNFQCNHCQVYYMPLFIDKLKDGPKALILENGFEIDIPEELIRYLEYHKTEWVWYDMRQKFWPENREVTFKFFSELPEGQLLACHTCFEDYQQLELIIELLHKLRHKKFIFKIMHGCLAEDLIDFYAEQESTITPRHLEKALERDGLSEEAAGIIFSEIYAFKKEMNKKFLEVLEAHEIWWVGYKNFLFKNLDDIKKVLL